MSISNWLLTLFAAGIGAYLGSYLKKKGENLATQEDIKHLTTTTEEIKAKISTEVWDRQKQWEMKRDVIFRGAKDIANITDSMVGLHSVATANTNNKAEWFKLRNEECDKWFDVVKHFEETVTLVSVTCDPKTYQAFLELEKFCASAGADILQGKAENFQRDLNARIKVVKQQMRLEVGVRVETELSQAATTSNS